MRTSGTNSARPRPSPNATADSGRQIPAVHGRRCPWPSHQGTQEAGWDIARAIDEMVEGTKDPPHFERAVKLGRVLVTNDAGQEARAQQWYEAKRSFPGLIVWRQAVYDQMSYGDLVEAFEEIARQEDPLRALPDHPHLAQALKRTPLRRGTK